MEKGSLAVIIVLLTILLVSSVYAVTQAEDLGISAKNIARIADFDKDDSETISVAREIVTFPLHQPKYL